MAFRIHRGIWQFRKPDGAYESKYKLNDSGQLVETDTEGNEIGGMTASVSWTSVSGRPTALSGFTNDLGNYGGWLSTSGKAADSETVDGVDSSRIVYGDGANGRSISRTNSTANTSDSSNASGFYFGNNVTGLPTTGWWNWVTVRGNSWSGSDGYHFQLAGSFWSDDFRIRRMESGSNKAWVTLVHSGNVGSQSVNYASTAGNSSTTSQTSFSSLSTGGGLRDSLNRRFVVPDGGSYATSTSVITGAIRIKLPTQGSGMMMTCTAKVYEYSLSKSFTITFGGHRDGANWYNQFCYIDGDTNRGNLTVRFGVSDGRDCVWIGETNSSWSYPQVFITDMQVGYTAIDSRWASGWSIDFVTSFDTINRTSTAYAKITNANIGDQSVNYAASAGNADTVDGWHRDDLRAWGNLTGVPSTFSPSAHTHDDRYYTESEVDSLLAGKQAAGTYLTSLPSHNHDDRYFTETESDSRFLKLAGGTLTGQLNLHAGSYEGSIVFGSHATWRTGIRQHDDGDAELRIWAKHASGMIFIATGYDGEPADIARPTDGLAIQGNKLGIGNFSTSDPAYKLHVKGDIYADGGSVRVSGNNVLYFESYGGGWNMSDTTWIRAYNDKNIYTGGSIEAGGSVRADSGILDSNRRFVIPGGASTVNHPSGRGGAIRINLPTATYGINTMMSMTVQVYEYSTGQSFTIRCGGYNYYTHDWYNVFAYLLNDSGKGGDVPVYFGNDGTRDIIWIGNPDWSWSYPNVFVTDFQAGHSQSEYWKTGWSISFDTAARTNVTASRTAYRQIDTGTIGSQSVSSATTATTLATARTLTIGNTGKTFNGSANVSWTLAEIGAQAAGSYAAASHTHDDRYYTESESDTRFATAAQGAKADSALQSLPAHTHDDRYYTESESLSLFARKDTNSAIGGNLVIGNGTYGSATAYGNSGARLMFSGSDSNAQGNYYIGTNHENYGGDYSKLDLRWHTGIRMGAQPGYGGIRFYNNEDLDSRLMSIGESDTNVRIDNNLWIGGAGGWITDLLAGKQASGSYAAASHTHAISDVTGLQGALDGKQAAGSYAASSHTHDYVPLAGGTMSGTLTLEGISGVSQTVPNSYGAYLHLGNWGVGRTAADAVLVNTAYRADYATSLFDMNISRFTNDSGYITAYGAQGANGNFYIDDNYGYGIVGLYSATRYQGVFAMGDAYKLSANGTSAGSLYGIAWTHSNIGGESKSGLGHQALFMMNGRTYTAIGSGIWTDGTITTTSHGTSANWNTAYGWGDHRNGGYLTSVTAHTHSASEVGLGNVSNAAQVTTSYNSSLNSDSRNSRGVTRLYRRDSDSDYSVQTNWTGSHWHIRGYNGDTFHAEARVGYADSAGSASSASSASSATTAVNLSGGNVTTSGNNLYIQNGGVNNYRIHHTGTIGVFDVTSRFSIREMSSIWSATRYEWGNYMSYAWFDVDPWGDNWGIGGNPTSWKTVNRGSFLTFGFEDWSDRRHKSAIVEIDNAVDKVKAISGYTYWKRGSEVREAGVIAQDVLAVLPEAVGGTEEGYSVKPAALIGLLMKAVKEQQETIDALTARIETLENK